MYPHHQSKKIMTNTFPQLTVTASVHAPVEKVWQYYTEPAHVVQWNNASPDWHTPRAENDLRTGGRFLYRMEARDGSFGFDFTGTYDAVEEWALIQYTMDDSRKVSVTFRQTQDGTEVTTVFDAESMNPLDMQQAGWQAILDNFKRYTEQNG